MDKNDRGPLTSLFLIYRIQKSFSKPEEKETIMVNFTSFVDGVNNRKLGKGLNLARD